jgi:acyl carrier protein
MSTNEILNDFIVEQSSGDKDKVMSGTSFFDDLNADSLKVVELIMVASTGQKDIFNQLKLNASTLRR